MIKDVNDFNSADVSVALEVILLAMDGEVGGGKDCSSWAFVVKEGVKKNGIGTDVGCKLGVQLVTEEVGAKDNVGCCS